MTIKVPRFKAAEIACQIYGINRVDLVSRRRHRQLIAARSLAIWAMRQEPPMPCSAKTAITNSCA